MNTNHWRKILRQNREIEKLLPKTVPGKRDGSFVTLPMKKETIAKIEALKKKMGLK